MTVKSYVVGPGTLVLGTGGLAISSQLTNLRVEPTANVSRADTRKVLSGEEKTGRRRVTYSWKLAGTLFQDISTGGVVEFAYINRGEGMPFTYVPNEELERGVSGVVYIDPLVIGGEVDGDDPTGDFSWDIEGTPFFGDYDPVTQEVEPLV